MLRLRRSARPRRRAPLAALGALGAGLLLAACSDSPTDPKPGEKGSTDTGPKVGDILRLNTQANSACGSIANRGARVAAVSNRAIVVADTGNPAGGFSDAEYASIAATFDTLVYPVDVRHFGAPEDLDNNGRTIIFYTRAVNELTPASVQYVIGGFFIARDLFPKVGNASFQGCAGSNEGEVMYLLVPDPSGAINGNVRRKADVLRTSLSTVAHEFQHLINASRRLFVLDQNEYYEEVWLNEGLSHIAEEATFYQAGGLSPAGQPGDSPRANLAQGAFTRGSRAFTGLDEYNSANLGRISTYFRTVQDSTLLGLKVNDDDDPDDDGLATRGAAWAFLRYAADRVGGADADFTQKLVNGPTLGLGNLRAATGAGAQLGDWVRDWTVANMADDVAPALDPRFQYQSWDFRSVLALLRSNSTGYPLATRPLVNGETQSDSVAGGTAAYYTFSVPAGATADVRTRGPGGAAVGPAVRLSLVRFTAPEAPGGPAVTTYGAGEGGDITVTNAGAAAAQYALVATNSNLENPRAKQTVEVTATGRAVPVVASVGPAGLRASRQPGPTVARLREAAEGGLVVTDVPLQQRFREMAERELAPRVAGARAWYQARKGGQ